MKKIVKIFLLTGLFILLCLSLAVAYIQWGLSPEKPILKHTEILQTNRQILAPNFYKINTSWLKKSDTGLWEEYLEGEPFERGVLAGKLGMELQKKQEEAFVEQIKTIIPSENYLKFLKFFIRIFNRNLAKNIPEEYKAEILGESFSAPKEFDFIAPAYDRLLNYHAAHDIGHALQSLALVGCSSFAAWNNYTADSSLLMGRNFDFYVGDKFAEDKIVLFVNPTQGHKFAMITWAGMLGCTSGMNMEGLTVTINAAKSDIPTGSATPISLLAREILQYASTIEEAFAIAKKRKTFVSESILIGSAHDKQSAIIEKSPKKIALLRSTENYQLCTNHYQSDSFKNEENNKENIKTSASLYRFNCLKKYFKTPSKNTPESAVQILRDQQGADGKDIGMGNEKTLNQLIAHHSIIFKPAEKKFWISTSPFQLGKFYCYDLNEIFKIAPSLTEKKEIYAPQFTLAEDSFLHTSKWTNFSLYKTTRDQIKSDLKTKKQHISVAFLENEFPLLNPQFWETYFWQAQYFEFLNDKAKAIKAYKIALTKEINTTQEIDLIQKKIQTLSTP